MSTAVTIDRNEQRRQNTALARAAIRNHFTGEGAVHRRWRFAYDAFVYGVFAAAGLVLFAAAAFGIGVSVGLGHEEALAQFHAWMVETPFEQVRVTVDSFAGRVMHEAAVAALLLGPLIAFIRTVPVKPATTEA
ncbi:MAG: hypothetical protein ACREPE_10975 [Lysobacter sp.]